MSFLDAISKVEKKEEVIEVNPLLKGKVPGNAPKKPSPFSKPSPFTKDPADKNATSSSAAPFPAKPIFRAPAELSEETKAKETEVTKVEDEVKETTTNAEKAEIEAIEEDKVEIEETEKTTEEEEVKTIEAAETIEAAKTIEAAETIEAENKEEALLEEVIKEEVKETPKKRTRKTKAASKDDVSSETNSEPIQIFSTEISYEEAIANISSPFINDEFEALKQEIVAEINSIEISADMNSITAKEVNSKLAALYQKIWFENQAAKALYDQLNQKDNGLIDRTRSLFIDGQNDAQRKKSGIEACIRFTSSASDDAINLYEMLDSAREQHYFFKAAMEHLDFKKNIMISMNAALKIEEKVLGHELQ